MKIRKNKQQSNQPIKSSTRYDKAQQYIQSAIDVLTEESLASKDVVASESIANLSVVMLDLKSSENS